MLNLKNRPAAEIGVEPCHIRHFEQEGLVYFLWADIPVAGAQCSQCHTILWTNQRTHPILGERTPARASSSDLQYSHYYKEKIERLLASMPRCPHCGNSRFDRFVNNTHYPRFSSGVEVPHGMRGDDVIPEDPHTVFVHYLTDD